MGSYEKKCSCLQKITHNYLNSFQRHLKDMVYDRKEHPSICEMWKVIDSVEIKKEAVGKIFTTHKARSKLCDAIAKQNT